MENKIILVSMPIMEAVFPNLGMEVIATSLRASGSNCDVLYGNLLLDPGIDRHIITGREGQGIFTPLLFKTDHIQHAETLAEYSLRGKFYNDLMFDERVLDFVEAFYAAEVCIKKCLDSISPGCYGVAGFSVVFDAQKVASLVLAQKLKERDGCRIVFGGTACDGGMGEALMDRFPFIDAVVEGDADRSIQQVISAVQDPRNTSNYPAGVIFRKEGCNRRTKAPSSLPPMSSVFFPDYASYIKQLMNSEYFGTVSTLTFEASRGCWWGEKHPCTFCGLRADGFEYRERDYEILLRHLHELQLKYNPGLLYATDAIMSRRLMTGLLPEIVRHRRLSGIEFRFFFEIKSNIKESDAILLAEAGVVEVQPGIESFSTNVLKIIDKGTTALQQVQCLKWLHSQQIVVVYALIVGIPGETWEDCLAATNIMKAVHHLPPPTQLNLLLLNRFSVYWRDPEQNKISGFKAPKILEAVYNSSDSLWLQRVSYDFDYTVAESESHSRQERYNIIQKEINAWKSSFADGDTFIYVEAGDSLLFVRKTGDTLDVWDEIGLEAEILCLAESIASDRRSASIVGIAMDKMEQILQSLESRGIIVRDGGSHLNVAIRADRMNNGVFSNQTTGNG